MSIGCVFVRVLDMPTGKEKGKRLRYEAATPCGLKGEVMRYIPTVVFYLNSADITEIKTGMGKLYLNNLW